MARWERDPVLRRQLTWLLVTVEALALTVNAYFVIAAYLRRVLVAVAPKLLSNDAFLAVVIVLTGIYFAAVVVQGYQFLRGRPWVRTAFLVQNSVWIVLGILWFAHNLAGQGNPNKFATWGGLLLPLVTLFPLIWPLLSLRPMAPVGGRG